MVHIDSLLILRKMCLLPTMVIILFGIRGSAEPPLSGAQRDSRASDSAKPWIFAYIPGQPHSLGGPYSRISTPIAGNKYYPRDLDAAVVVLIQESRWTLVVGLAFAAPADGLGYVFASNSRSALQTDIACIEALALLVDLGGGIGTRF
jgi:hypothetical protein